MANDDFFTPIENRLQAILADGRGVDGSLGAEAQARAIVAGTFRRPSDNSDLADPNQPPETFDRGFVIRFRNIMSEPGTANPYNMPQFHRVDVAVSVGYLYSAGVANAVNPKGTETANGAAVRPDRRALSDGRRIERAIRFGPLRGSDTNPSMIAAFDFATAWQDLGGGRSLGVTTFTLQVESDETTAYGP